MSRCHPSPTDSCVAPAARLDLPGAGGFHTTHWSVVLLAGQSEAPEAAAALESLCRAYWFPLYAYVRRQGHDPPDAQDLTQAFFARLLEKKHLRLAAQARGKFRSFLLKSLQHFLINEWGRGQARKRGGGQTALSLDDEAAERSYLQEVGMLELPAERHFDQRWAVTLLERAMNCLGDDYAKAGKRVIFDQLRALLLTEASAETYRAKGAVLGLGEGAVKVALHRLRQRFAEAVRAEIAQTVTTPAEVDDELRHLMATLSA